MKILYIYPHPDDESFGPAHVMHKQLRQGHEVYLLTLTRGGATRQRHQFGYSIEEMGAVRHREMLEVSATLGLSGMTVLDLPDGGLKEMDPRDIEVVVREEIERLKPEVIVSYPVHGISGFHDHLVTHAVVKRVFVEMKEDCGYPRRLAMLTLTPETAEKVTLFKLSSSTAEEIDCVVTVSDADIEKNLMALDCYKTFQETIVKSGVRDLVSHSSPFELFQEAHHPPLTDLFEGL